MARERLSDWDHVFNNFKVNPCGKNENHNRKQCHDYHNEKDRRRSCAYYLYTWELCPKSDIKNCTDDSCQYAHNKVEQLYHPERFKKKFCSKSPNDIRNCLYGDWCSFAHSEDEIRIELLEKMIQDDNFNLFLYKTVFCPNVKEHDKSSCVYAHNYQDFRRDPKKYLYTKETCKDWVLTKIPTYSEGKCKNLMNCKKCCCHNRYKSTYESNIFGQEGAFSGPTSHTTPR